MNKPIMQSIAIQGTLIGRNENAGPNGIGVDEIGSMFTLTKADVHAVAFSCSEVGPTMGSSGPPYSRTGNERVESDALVISVYGIDGEQNATEEMIGTLRSHQSGGYEGASCLNAMQVRRLTVKECERLQGFSDDYTNVPYRNKPASDGPRYRALGNSMAVPVMRWIGQRIQMLTEVVP